MMKVVNESRGFTISTSAILKDTFLGRLRGLMLSGRKDVVLEVPREGILESSIHMMFMLYPIDVVWVNDAMEVVDVKRRVPPFNPLKPSTWRTYAPSAPARYVVEVAAGDVGGTNAGDKVLLED